MSLHDMRTPIRPTSVTGSRLFSHPLAMRSTQFPYHHSASPSFSRQFERSYALGVRDDSASYKIKPHPTNGLVELDGTN